MALLSSQRVILIVAVGLAFFLRLNASFQERSPLKKDAADYDRLALSIMEGKGYRDTSGNLTARRPPLYPVFLACAYKVFGHDHPSARMVQALLGTITVLLIARLSGLLFGNAAACWAAVLAAIYPPAYTYSFGCQALISETLFAFLLVVFFLSLFGYMRAPRWPSAVFSGIALGLAILTRPIPLFLPIVLPFFLLFTGHAWRLVLRYQILLCLTVFFVLLPWTVRNYRVFDAIVPVSTHGGMDFYLGNHPGADGIGGTASGTEPYFRNVMVPQSEMLDAQGKSEAEKSKFFFHQAMEFLRHHPREAFKLTIQRAFMFLDARSVIEKESHRLRVINYAYLIVLFGTMAGFFVGRGQLPVQRDLWLLVLLFAYFFGVHTVVAATDRYRFPVESLLIVAASFSFAFLGDRLRAKNHA